MSQCVQRKVEWPGLIRHRRCSGKLEVSPEVNENCGTSYIRLMIEGSILIKQDSKPARPAVVFTVCTSTCLISVRRHRGAQNLKDTVSSDV